MNKTAVTNLTFIFCLSIFSSSCIAQQSSKQKPQLVFKSGFEGTSRVAIDEKSNDYGAKLEYLTGQDSLVSGKKGNWDLDWKNQLSTEKMQIQYTGGDSSKRYAKVVAEPGNAKNKVLKFWLNDSWSASENQEKARIQANLYGFKTGLKEFYQSVRVFIPEDFNTLKSYPEKISWFTISEFWNNEWWVKGEPHGFRITLGIGKEKGDGDFHFLLEGEDPGQKRVWEADHNSTRVAVPVGRWFKMDYYFKEGDDQTGRFYLAITPDGGEKKIVYDIQNFTHMTKDQSPDGLTGYNPMKLYTSKELVAYMKGKGKTLEIYWDDLEIWKNKKP